MSLANYQLNGTGFNQLFNTENNDYYGNIATNYRVAGTNIGENINANTFSRVAGTITACGFTTPILQYNTGASWSLATQPSGVASENWDSVSISSSGQYTVACVSNGKIYYSNDYGQSWTVSTSASTYWESVSISSSGQYAIACVFNGKIYYSNNYGETWTVSTSASATWYSVSISSSGQYAIVCIYGGQI